MVLKGLQAVYTDDNGNTLSISDTGDKLRIQVITNNKKGMDCRGVEIGAFQLADIIEQFTEKQ